MARIAPLHVGWGECRSGGPAAPLPSKRLSRFRSSGGSGPESAGGGWDLGLLRATRPTPPQGRAETLPALRQYVEQRPCPSQMRKGQQQKDRKGERPGRETHTDQRIRETIGTRATPRTHTATRRPLPSSLPCCSGPRPETTSLSLCPPTYTPDEA